MFMAKPPSSPGKGNGSKYGSAFFGPPRAAVTFLDCDPASLQQAIDLVSKDGDCIMLSRTSDGGALHVRILSGGLVEKWYPDDAQSLQDVLEGICRALQDG